LEVSEAQAGARRRHRRGLLVDHRDDLAAVDALQEIEVTPRFA
jgi:hypothetical protein